MNQNNNVNELLSAQYGLYITFNLETKDYFQQTYGQIKMTRTMTQMIKKKSKPKWK